MNTVLSFILVLGVLIFVHELGHFLFAKLFNVKVLKFSLGFGPRIFGRKYGETEYIISALPLGGYVKMVGEGDFDVPEEQLHRSFSHKPVWQRFFIILAGPLFNLLLPVVLFFSLFFFLGIPEGVDNTTIGNISQDSPAEKAGLLVGDEIVAIDEVETPQWMDILTLVKESEGRTLKFTLIRNQQEIVIDVTPEVDAVKNVFGEEVEKRYLVGIMHKDRVKWTEVGLFEAAKAGLQQTWMYIYLTVMSFIKLFQRVIPATELGGPILIAKLAGEQMQAGWINLMYFMGLLSVNLGILNLLPIPVLDGGHLVFLTYESIRRKPMSDKVQIFAQQIGMALLATLMIFVFYNDIARLFK